MPIIKSNYTPPIFFRDGHTNTIATKLLRKVKPPSFQRKRITTPDGDFLDLDCLQENNARVAVLIHGLEGSSSSTYMLGMSREMIRNSWDVVCINLRGCSGEANQTFPAYHSGKTEDLELVINTIEKSYSLITLIGFSLGGNIVLKYIGEQKDTLLPKIKVGVGVSVPCDLQGSAIELSKPKNRIYMLRFLKSMLAKTAEKYTLFPHEFVDYELLQSSTDFEMFDNLYTAPANGFSDAQEYWEKCSSVGFLEHIRIPTLLINALDDPFLSSSCYPTITAKNNENLFLEMPKNGGHLGFLSPKAFRGQNWLENRVLGFVSEHIMPFDYI